MYCGYCGNQIGEGMSFCSYCGKRFTPAQPGAQAPNSPAPVPLIREPGQQPPTPNARRKKRRGKKALTAVLAVVLVLAIGAGLFFVLSDKLEKENDSEKPIAAASGNRGPFLLSKTQTYFYNSGRTETRRYYNDRGLLVKMDSSVYEDGETVSESETALWTYTFDEHDNPTHIAIVYNEDDERVTINISIRNNYDGGKLKESVITKIMRISEDDEEEETLSNTERSSMNVIDLIAENSTYYDSTLRIDGTQTLVRHRDGHLICTQIDDFGFQVIKTEYEYDENGNSTEMRTTYIDGEDGHTTGTYIQAYDSENRLSSITYEPEDGSTAEYRFEYHTQTDENGVPFEKGTPVEIRNIDSNAQIGPTAYYRNASGEIVESITELGTSIHNYYNDQGFIVKTEVLYNNDDNGFPGRPTKIVTEYAYQ